MSRQYIRDAGNAKVCCAALNERLFICQLKQQIPESNAMFCFAGAAKGRMLVLYRGARIRFMLQASDRAEH